MSFIIAIDGPAGAGKGTVTESIAKDLNLVCIDTGAMYRCVALEIINQNVSLEEEEKIKEILESIDIRLERMKDQTQIVYLNGINVSRRIREKDVSAMVSPVATVKIIRHKMVELQREMAKGKNVIMEGRDIGTYVFPNADVKVYLDAMAEERAKRRYKQNKEKGLPMTYEEILENIKDRDIRDSSREMGALSYAEDAIYLDSTDFTIEEVVQKVKEIVINKMKGKDNGSC